ncbi:DNA processing protein [Paraoerskovia marina]|uniref:DNA processing protein n=1 Tax=Paraoerskovia marina TaxID=545619 RepID=A0A1H1PDT1_9CELL|nr:DNA processing protein [Paraoerskovia marina]
MNPLVSVADGKVTRMDEAQVSARVLAALEVLPADPTDLTNMLLSETDRDALLLGAIKPETGLLARHISAMLDSGRESFWRERIGSILRGGGASFLPAHCGNFPRALLQVWDAPPFLFCQGALARQDSRSLAIVGSRRASFQSQAAAFEIAQELATAGWEIVSGLAIGVDTQAHLGALQGGRTTAVLGSGLDKVLPSENLALARDVAESGALVSQFPPGSPGTSTTFLRRNRTIAGLSTASLVIEAEARSGSRHELECAISYDRAALLWEPVMARMSWARDLVESGTANFVSSVDDIVAVVESRARQ